MVTDYGLFVREASGGKQGARLADIDDYVKQLEVKRTIRGAIFGALSKIVTTSAERYAAAMVKAMYGCSEKFVSHGECKLFSCAEIGAALKEQKKDLVTMACTHMATFEKLAEGSKMTNVEKSQVRGKYESELVLYVHAKSKDYKAMLDICWAFFEEVKCAGMKPPKTWGKVPTRTPPGGAAASSGGMREAAVDGLQSQSSEVTRKGFATHSMVKSKSTSTTYVVLSIGADEARMQKGDGSIQAVKHNVLLRDYVVVGANAKPIEDFVW